MEKQIYKIDNFQNKFKLAKLTQKEREKSTRSIAIKDVELVV